MPLPRPGRVLRAALVIFGVLFLPMACWFAYVDFRRYWINSLALFIIGIAFLRWGLTRDEDSWVSAIDDLDGPGR
ncbi:MAG TPA: hypothetical protein VGM50_13105 [Gemmatimonadaceae bacterium]|jgi:hypothetical protein